MSEDIERDLTAAFEELRAPRSTAHYASRSPGLDVPRATASRWPQALAAGLAVAVALVGAGTFLALRSARQGGPAGSGAYPAARAAAAMAFDSTAGVTVLYGGTDGSGRQLTDTWTWDGSSWHSAASGPASLIDVHLVDDPADAGVLLLGVPAPPAGSGGGSTGSGCVGVGSVGPPSTSAPAPGTVVPARVTGIPVDATPPLASATATVATGAPAVSPVPATPAAVPTALAPPPTCAAAPAPVSSAEQTWIFTGQGWRRAASGDGAVMPPASAQLAFDAASRQVIAVSSGFLGCNPPRLMTGEGSFACPFAGAGSAAAGSTPAVAPDVCIRSTGACLNGGGVVSWSWSAGAWKRSAAPLATSGLTLLFSDPATGHATLMSQSGQALYGDTPCGATPGTAPSCAPVMAGVTTWTWSGSGWGPVSQVHAPPSAPSFGGATVAAVSGHILVLTNTGDTWTFAAGQWTQDTVAAHPSGRSGASLAEGPGRTAVLFGGAPGGGVTVSSDAGPSTLLGSDTWTWNGERWSRAGGVAPSAPPIPSGCPTDKSGAIPPCVGPPVNVAPATASGQPPHGMGSPIPQGAPTP